MQAQGMSSQIENYDILESMGQANMSVVHKYSFLSCTMKVT